MFVARGVEGKVVESPADAAEVDCRDDRPVLVERETIYLEEDNGLALLVKALALVLALLLELALAAFIGAKAGEADAETDAEGGAEVEAETEPEGGADVEEEESGSDV